jgi:hypothetical protein
MYIHTLRKHQYFGPGCMGGGGRCKEVNIALLCLVSGESRAQEGRGLHVCGAKKTSDNRNFARWYLRYIGHSHCSSVYDQIPQTRS